MPHDLGAANFAKYPVLDAHPVDLNRDLYGPVDAMLDNAGVPHDYNATKWLVDAIGNRLACIEPQERERILAAWMKTATESQGGS